MQRHILLLIALSTITVGCIALDEDRAQQEDVDDTADNDGDRPGGDRPGANNNDTDDIEDDSDEPVTAIVTWVPQAHTDGLSVQNAYDGLMTVTSEAESKDAAAEGVIETLEVDVDVDGTEWLVVEGNFYLSDTGAFYDNGEGKVYLINARNDVECELAYAGTFSLNGERLWLDHGNAQVDSLMEVGLSVDNDGDGEFDCADDDAPHLRIRL